MKKNEKFWREFSFYLSPRYILGIILIITSFLSAYLVSRSADRTITVWSATSDLAPGSVIGGDQISPTRVRLLDGASRYLGTDAQIIGTAIVRPIGKDELIPASALASEVNVHLQRVPISIERSYAPVGIEAGAIVDLYVIPDANSAILGDHRKSKPRLLIERISIDAIDQRANELGGPLIMTVLVERDLVQGLIEALPGHDLVLVRRIDTN